MKSIERGASLLVTLYQIMEPKDGPPLYTRLGEIVIEENPDSADRHPEVVSSFLATFDSGEERAGAKVIGFQRVRSAMQLLVEGLKALGFVQ
jgi:hypothetical protein